MKFTIAFQYRRHPMVFVIKAEKDDIFIAYPKVKKGRGEPIFLTKANGQWVGDSNNKKLVIYIGREIEAARKKT